MIHLIRLIAEAIGWGVLGLGLLFGIFLLLSQGIGYKARHRYKKRTPTVQDLAKRRRRRRG